LPNATEPIRAVVSNIKDKDNLKDVITFYLLP
jgi:hypothetical protein